MFPEEKNLHFTLINLTKGFSYSDLVNYRKERNWEKYNLLNPIDKLRMIMKEIMEYKNGYIEDNNYD